jgi:hypothetical protein
MAEILSGISDGVVTRGNYKCLVCPAAKPCQDLKYKSLDRKGRQKQAKILKSFGLLNKKAGCQFWRSRLYGDMTASGRHDIVEGKGDRDLLPMP